MNTQLITIYDNPILTKAIDARDIHRELGVNKKFSDWIKQQIVRADLIENEDYIKVHLKGNDINQQLTNVGDRIDYFITLDVGKNLAMMSNCQKGKDVRKYFIMCEKELRKNHPTTYLEAIKALVVKEEERLELENKINNSTLFSNKEKAYDKERVYNKDIKKMYPYLNNSINNIMEFFGKYKYKDTSSYVREEVEICVEEFLETCTKEISSKKRSVIIMHECLIGGKLCVKKDLAIKYLGYREEQFDE